MDHPVIAIDIAKKVFQLHWVEHDTGSIERLQLKRTRMLEWFTLREPSLVVMEACGGAHEWARALAQLGHEVRLISPRKVRPFVQRNKTDAADAYLRTLLMHAARSVVLKSHEASTWPWLQTLLKRRPYNVVVAAVANKLARTIWAVLAKGQAWNAQAWQGTH